MVVLKDNILYCANVGNISAALFFTEKIYSFKFKIIELSTDDSAMNLNNYNNNFEKKCESKNFF